MEQNTTFEAASYTVDGTARERVTLPAELFDGTVNVPVMHQVVKAYLANQRQANAHTKNRRVVTGGNQKPWKQKGTGRARQGSTRAPQWTGGGVVWGPSPRHYTVKVNRKARRAALRSALSVHAARGSVSVVDAGAFGPPSTKQARGLLDGRLGGSVVVLLAEDEVNVAKSFRNLAGVAVLPVTAAGVADVVRAASLVVSRAALGALTELAGKPVSRGTV